MCLAKSTSRQRERADWLLKQGRVLSLEEAINPVIEKWTRTDFNGVAKWLAGLDPSPTRDQAVATFAPLAAKEDSEAALEWGLSVEDEEIRESVLEKIRKAIDKTASRNAPEVPHQGTP